ncbi:hypothetical protein B0H66DRAFT_399956 [Apodospora peruviana]|uniref:Uncharacterized protein n=1 Tax=Apodospora peruviana TaxID=516989 RepID=A0AAE0HT98_9PEZI|nr:hypothetical protein B0H66DRAFT_399956 [Apodospora peruviana]
MSPPTTVQTSSRSVSLEIDPAYDSYVWREITPGVWQRDADEVEVFYSSLAKRYAGSGRMHFAITGHVSVTVRVPLADASRTIDTVEARFDDALRSAWLSLRHRSPTIASQVHFDTREQKWKKKYRTVADQDSRNAWLHRTLRFISNGQTGAEWANSDPPAPELATLFVIVCPSSSAGAVRRDLVLRSPHDIIDGIGTLQLLNSFIHIAADRFDRHANPSYEHVPLLDGSETQNLSPPYRVAAAVPPSPSPEQQARLTAPEELSTALPRPQSIETIGIPYRQGPLLPGKHQRVARTFTAERTAKLLATLKAVGATPTHAFHAAIAMTVRALHADKSQAPPPSAADEKQVQYVNYILRNERQNCKPPFNSPGLHPATVYHSVSGTKLTITMPATPPSSTTVQDAAFARILTDMREFYHSVRDDRDHSALAPYIWAAATPRLPFPESEVEEWNIAVPPPNPKPSVSISSMGNLDNIVAQQLGDHMEVHTPWVTGEELGTGLGLFLGTFRGRMELSAAFNEAWHTADEVNGFLDRCAEIVFGCVDRQDLNH